MTTIGATEGTEDQKLQVRRPPRPQRAQRPPEFRSHSAGTECAALDTKLGTRVILLLEPLLQPRRRTSWSCYCVGPRGNKAPSARMNFAAAAL